MRLVSMSPRKTEAYTLSTRVGSFRMPKTTSGHRILLEPPQIQLRALLRCLSEACLEGSAHKDPYVAVGIALAVSARVFLSRCTGAPHILSIMELALSSLQLDSVHCFLLEEVIK